MLKNRRTVHLKTCGWLSNIIFSFFLDCGNSLPWSRCFPGLSYHSLYLNSGGLWCLTLPVGGWGDTVFPNSDLNWFHLLGLTLLGSQPPWATCDWVGFMTQLAPGGPIALFMVKALLGSCIKQTGTKMTVLQVNSVPLNRSREIQV